MSYHFQLFFCEELTKSNCCALSLNKTAEGRAGPEKAAHVIHPREGFLERNRARIQARPTGSQAATHFAVRYSIYPERSGASKEWDEGTAAGLSYLFLLLSKPFEASERGEQAAGPLPANYQARWTERDSRSGDRWG
jgi:hypothetical protein